MDALVEPPRKLDSEDRAPLLLSFSSVAELKHVRSGLCVTSGGGRKVELSLAVQLAVE